MDKPENASWGTGRRRLAAARAGFKRRRVRAQSLVSRQSLQTAATLTRVARRAWAWRGVKCKACGKRLPDGALFCPACGVARAARAPAKTLQTAVVKKPLLLRRVLAQLIDRMVTLPFLVLVYAGWPQWVWAAVVFQLLFDGFTGRGPGKWICRLRVADAKSLKPCAGLRAILRRVGAAAGQVAYCRWEWLPFALGYDFIALLFVWRDRAGQRLEDKLLGTRVLSEGIFRQRKQECSACGSQLSARARFCPRCGNRPKQI
jgi:uncharacterized RDD family membrane protein YckC